MFAFTDKVSALISVMIYPSYGGKFTESAHDIFPVTNKPFDSLVSLGQRFFLLLDDLV